jgi:hypothetical protein
LLLHHDEGRPIEISAPHSGRNVFVCAVDSPSAIEPERKTRPLDPPIRHHHRIALILLISAALAAMY